MGRAVQACVDDAQADHDRQGGLDDQDVARLVAAHRLDDEQAGAVRALLTDRGLLDLEIPDDLVGVDLHVTVQDSVGALLHGVREVRLLTAEQEVQLGRRVHLGARAEEEDEPTAESRRRIADGRVARNQLVVANIRLALSIARTRQGLGLDLEDLLHDAVLGLIRAAEKFDYTMGYKFSTYATWWIRQSLERGIADKARTIRLPVHMVEALNKMSRVRRQLFSRLHREPTVGELALELDLSAEKVAQMLEYIRTPASLDAFVGDADIDLGAFLADRTASVEREVEAKWRDEEVRRRLASMSHLCGGRAEEVLLRRFGIDRERPQTLEEIGRHFGVTRERVRQIEGKAMAAARQDRFHDIREELRGTF